MAAYKATYSIQELVERLNCSVDTVIRYIEDGQIALFCKSYVVKFETSDAKAVITIAIKNKKEAKDLKKLVEKFNEENPQENPLNEKNVTAKISFDLPVANDAIINRSINEVDDKLYELVSAFQNGEILEDAYESKLEFFLDKKIELENSRNSDFLGVDTIEQFSLCFVYAEDISGLEDVISKNNDPNLHTPDLTRSELKRVNDFNLCITDAINDFIDDNDYHPVYVEEILNRLNSKPPLGRIVVIDSNSVSINGSTPKKLTDFTRTIKSKLKELADK